MSTQHSTPRQGIPFVPSPSAVNEALVRSFVRAAAALINNKGNTVKAVAEVKGDPGAVRMINRTAVAPTNTSATAFKQSTIAYWVSILKGPSAIAAILERATKLEFGRAGGVWCAGIPVDASNIKLVSEGSPRPVISGDVSAGVTLVPQKIEFDAPASDELLQYSNFESVLRAMVGAALQIGPETYLFDDSAGDTTRPQGLRYGVTAETASSDTTSEGCIADVALICSKVARVAGLSDAIIVADPLLATKLWCRLPMLRVPVYASAALDGIVMAIACSGVAFCGSPDAPKITLSNTGVLHMDSDPTPLSTSGQPVPYPVRSLFQTSMSSLRVILDITWAPRASSGVVAWIADPKW